MLRQLPFAFPARLVPPVLVAIALAACRSDPTPLFDELHRPAGAQAVEEDRAPEGEDARAIAAIRRGDHEEAHGILSRLLFAGHVADARAAFADGRPEDGLLSSEAALALFPRDVEALLVDARGRLALAEKGIVEGLPFTEILIQDALDASLAAGSSPAARMQAARAAYLLGRTEDALRYATEGMSAAHGAEINVDRLPQRTLAETAFAAYAAAKDAGVDAATTLELNRRTETALASLLGRTPSDPWVHRTLAGLYERERKLAEARDALMRGIDRVQSGEARAELVIRLADLARRADDRPAIDTFLELVRRHPELAEGHWYAGEQRFWDAFAQLEAGDFQVAEFRAAEASFRRAGELKADLDAGARVWEATCRSGAAWCLYRTGDVAAAERAFRSMEEVLERGLEVRIEDRLPSGLAGLGFCARAYAEAGDLVAAAETNDFLRRYAPDEVDYANDAGFLFREAGYQLEIWGKRFCYAAQDLVDNAETVAAWRERAGFGAEIAAGSEQERDAFRVAANRAMDEARALMRKSAEAYRAAAALAPDDVRVINDAALILVYYLHEDIDAAKAMLLRCVERGAEQIAIESLEEQARFDLRSAWGDAHQNLGVLCYVYEDDRAAALAWFEKSMEIDPEPRGDVRDFWLPFLRGEIEAGEDEDYLAVKSWAEPCE